MWFVAEQHGVNAGQFRVRDELRRIAERDEQDELRQRLRYCAELVERLPEETWIAVALHCDPRTVLQLRAVCARFRRVFSDGVLWYRLLEGEFELRRPGRAAPPCPCKIGSSFQSPLCCVRHCWSTVRRAQKAAIREEEERQRELQETMQKAQEYNRLMLDRSQARTCARCSQLFVPNESNARSCAFHSHPYNEILGVWRCCQRPHADSGCCRGPHIMGQSAV